MRDRKGMGRGLAIVSAALLAAACASGEGGGGGARYVSDAPGQVVPPDEVVRIVEADRSGLAETGRVRYRVENVSGREQSDLVWSVTFHFPAEVRDGLAMPEVSETTSEMPLKLVAGGKSEVLEATCPNFARYSAAKIPVLATRLNLQVEEPVRTVARSSDGSPGTLFLSGKVECVGMSDDLYGQSTLWLEFQNVTNTKLPPFEVQAVFPDTGARTKRKAGAALEPGQRTRVELDLEGVDMGNREFAVKVGFRRM